MGSCICSQSEDAHEKLKEYTNHSLYFGKSRSISQTFSLGASMVIDDETESTPFEDRGGRLELVAIFQVMPT